MLPEQRADQIRKRLKGRMGEGLVTALFEEQGWRVQRFGLEKQLSLANYDLEQSAAANALRYLPDLLVSKQRANGQVQVFLVEVKTYRKCPSQARLERYLQFDGLLIAWVGPTGISAAKVGRHTHHPLPAEFNFVTIEEVGPLNFDTTIMKDFHHLSGALHEYPHKPSGLAQDHGAVQYRNQTDTA